jgi:hypothetical protein
MKFQEFLSRKYPQEVETLKQAKVLNERLDPLSLEWKELRLDTSILYILPSIIVVCFWQLAWNPALTTFIIIVSFIILVGWIERQWLRRRRFRKQWSLPKEFQGEEEL